MTIETAMTLSGLLFWLIIFTNIGSNQFGYSTTSTLETEANLQEIANDPGGFKIGFSLILVEHVFLILLAVLLFIAFGQYSILLGIVWLISRSIEGLMQIINKRNYWRLLDLARQYAGAGDVERNTFVDLRLSILKSKQSNFTAAQLLFSVGTLAYSILFVTYGVVPAIIGWFGIVASVFYGFGNVMTIVKPNFVALWNFGGLLVLLFEIALGAWLLFHSFFT